MAIKIADGVERHEFADGVWIEITSLTREMAADYYEQAQGDEQRFHDLVSENCINAWKGFIGQDDLPLPVCLAAKNSLRRNIKIGPWIEQRINGLIVIEETEIKNLPRSPGGDLTPAAAPTAVIA